MYKHKYVKIEENIEYFNNRGKRNILKKSITKRKRLTHLDNSVHV